MSRLLLRAALVASLLACIVSSTSAASLSLQNSSPCTAMMGVSATPFMCFIGGKLVTVSAGGTWGGTGFDDSCVATGVSGSIVCNQKTITCQGATSSKTSTR